MEPVAFAGVEGTERAEEVEGTEGAEAAGALRRAVGRADLCELLAATFAFPSKGDLARALVDGSYAGDLAGCLADAGASGGVAQQASHAVAAAFGSCDPAGLAESLRRGYSVLFLTPGLAPVWPYEAAFRFAAAGHREAPSLFRSPVALRVEASMREDGALPPDARVSPPDSAWGELSYLSELYGRQTAALASGATAAARHWEGRSRAFLRDHAGAWLPGFMRRTAEEASSGRHACGSEYAVLARTGLTAMSLLTERK